MKVIYAGSPVFTGRGARLLGIAGAAAFLVLASILAPMAHAQDYPSHPIKLVLPQPPGGIIDLMRYCQT